MSNLSVPERHQLKIARDTMRMHCTGARIMGGMDHKEAALVIGELTGRWVRIDPDCTCKVKTAEQTA